MSLLDGIQQNIQAKVVAKKESFRQMNMAKQQEQLLSLANENGGFVKCQVLRAKNLKAADLNGLSDPYGIKLCKYIDMFSGIEHFTTRQWTKKGAKASNRNQIKDPQSRMESNLLFDLA